LTEADYEKLEESWITREIADRALLARLDGPEAKALVGGRGPGDFGGIEFPYFWPGEVNCRGSRLRRDHPPVEYDDDGDPQEVKKYLAPPGSSNKLYFFPETPPELLIEISLPIIIVEGEKKTLALWRLANYNSSTPRFLPVGISGVWSWRGVIGKGPGPTPGSHRDVKGVITDLDRIVWSERTVYIAFDSDVVTNPAIQQARRALAKELRKRTANVLYVLIPQPASKP
jgi:hypothetical protein